MAVERPHLPPASPADRARLNPFTHPLASADPEGPFRIGELSRLSGVAVGTIKYYLREGLVPPGRATAKTQALYDGAHLRRLRLIRVLADVGGLSIAQIGEIVSVLEEGGEEPGALDQLVSYAIQAPGRGTGLRRGQAEDGAAAESAADARRATDAFVNALGFEVDPQAPARADLGEALAALRTLGIADNPIVFYEHARIAYELAEFEIAVSSPVTDRDASVETVAVGSVIFGAAFMALRRMAHEHETRRRLDELGLLPDASAAATSKQQAPD